MIELERTRAAMYQKCPVESLRNKSIVVAPCH